MGLKNLGVGLVISSTLASSFKSSFKTANTSIDALNTNINTLSKTKLNIKNFKTLSKDALKNKVALDKLGLSLKRAGVDIRHIDSDSRLLRSSLVKLKKAAKIDIKINANKAAFAQQRASIVGIGASMYGVTSIIKSANTVLKAQGEIKSLGLSNEGIKNITRAGEEMALKYGQVTAPEFIKASYDIKSGIASLSADGVKNFTKFAATTAVATKSSIGDMTKLYALGYGIFRKDFKTNNDFGKQFSGAIAGAVKAFRTDGPDLVSGISNIGASAHAMGISLAEELAIVGLSKSAFNSASEAGSGYRAFLDGAGKAQDKLGLKFTDVYGKMLPMADILGLIKAKFGDINFADNNALKDAFGSSEAIQTISALIPQIDELKRGQIGLEKAMAGGLSQSQAMAKAMDSGYGFEKMGNALSYLSFTMGKAVAPAIDVLATGLGGLAKGVAWLDDKVPFLIPIFSGLALGIMGLVTVLKIATLGKLAFKWAILSIRKSILISTASNLYNAMSLRRVGLSAIWARGKMLVFSAASKVAAASQWILNAAMTANPIGLVIAGVAALAVGAVVLYKNFAPFTDFVDGIWSKLKGFFSFVSKGWESVGSIIGSIGSFLGFGGSDKAASEKPTKKPLAKAVGVASVIALSSTIAVASPMQQQPLVKQVVASPMQQQPLVKQVVASPMQQQPLVKQASKEKHASTQVFHIQVNVHNPKDTVDVEKAVVQAMRKQSSGVSLSDEDI